MPTGDADYASTIERLQGALQFGINPSLDGIRELTATLGCPERECRCVQITGTNGKTSVTRMTGALLSAHGYRTGVYTSPHLVSYTERIEIDGEPLSEVDFARVFADVFDAAAQLGREFTEFELLTAGALHAFSVHGVEFACLEVGMGGRWDATSVVDPIVAVVTGVALDHTDRLGATREEIAFDKAHIITANSIPVIGPGCIGVDHIFLERALSLGHPRVFRVGIGDDPDITWDIVRRPRMPGGVLTLDIHGLREHRVGVHAPAYQAANVAIALGAAGAALFDVLDPEATDRILRAMTFPGRFHALRREPPLVIDGAHNPDAAEVLAGAIHDSFSGGLPVLVLGILADKDAEGIVRALAPVGSAFVATENGSPRCMPAAELADLIGRITGTSAAVAPDVGDALRVADRLSNGRGVVVSGSLYTAGAVYALGAEAVG